MSLDTLEMAAADLRNAALVIEHLGHTTGISVNNGNAQVCLYGALQLATDSALTHIDTAGTVKVWHAVSLPDGDHARLLRALDALADSLPTGLCAQCVPDADEGIDRPGAVVTHFNDYHCPGGDTAATLCRIAAYRAEGIASDARKLLTGSLLLTDNPRALVPA